MLGRFSIGGIIVFLVGVAAVVSALSGGESWKSLVAVELLAILFATTSIVLAAQTTGKVRTFWLGTAVVFCLAAILATASLPFFTFLVSRESGSADEAIQTWGRIAGDIGQLLGVFWCIAPANGLVAVFLHWSICPRSPEPR